MDAIRTLHTRITRWTAFVLAVACLACSSTDAQGAPLRTFGASRASAYLDQLGASPTLPGVWNRFLSTGPDVWAMTQSPAFSIPVRRSIWEILSGDPAAIATNPMIDYLVWRRDLSPFRFDRYHPYLGARLGQLQPSTDPVLPAILTPLVSVPHQQVIEPPIFPLAPLTTAPPSVPEPSGLVLIGLLSVWGIWRRRPRSGPAAK